MQAIAIDLKSFYASCECAVRGLDPLTTNLVVADVSRTEKTICLAVSPSLKALGIPGRPRLFEVIEKVRAANAERKRKNCGQPFTGKSTDAAALAADPTLEIDFIAATPQMALYMRRSTEIYAIYLKYVAPEDIHVYSIDEVFMDVTQYLPASGSSARTLAETIILDVLSQTGITATAGIGTNLYLAKIAMDIVAKHIPPDKHGVRIACLDELSYRRLLWTHRPLTDFWRVGSGYAKKLERYGLYTMGDIARCSVADPHTALNEDFLYKLFGVNAELLIDHAWGYEPCTIAQIQSYKPDAKSIGSGQVLSCPYSFEKGRLIVREMAENLALELVRKHLLTDRCFLMIGYDIENSKKNITDIAYKTDRYGRKIPEGARGTTHFDRPTSSTSEITDSLLALYDTKVNPDLTIRRVTVVAGNTVDENSVSRDEIYEQLDLFTDYDALQKQKEAAEEKRKKERSVQEALIHIQDRFGKTAVLKGSDLTEGARTIERLSQIGGHKA